VLTLRVNITIFLSVSPFPLAGFLPAMPSIPLPPRIPSLRPSLMMQTPHGSPHSFAVLGWFFFYFLFWFFPVPVSFASRNPPHCGKRSPYTAHIFEDLHLCFLTYPFLTPPPLPPPPFFERSWALFLTITSVPTTLPFPTPPYSDPSKPPWFHRGF